MELNTWGPQGQVFVLGVEVPRLWGPGRGWQAAPFIVANLSNLGPIHRSFIVHRDEWAESKKASHRRGFLFPIPYL